MSGRFDPSEGDLRHIAMTQQARAEELARRLGAGRRAVLSGQPAQVLLTLLSGHDPEPTCGGCGPVPSAHRCDFCIKADVAEDRANDIRTWDA